MVITSLKRLKIPYSIKVALAIGHWRLGIRLLSIQNSSMICLLDHQTIDSQCAITNEALPGWGSCVVSLNFKMSLVGVDKCFTPLSEIEQKFSVFVRILEKGDSDVL